MVRSGLRRIGERRLELHGGEVLLSRHLFHHFDVLWRENNQEIERENDGTQTYIKHTHTCNFCICAARRSDAILSSLSSSVSPSGPSSSRGVSASAFPKFSIRSLFTTCTPGRGVP